MIFGAGIAASDVAVSRSGNDMVFKVGASDQVTVQNWFSNPVFQYIEQIQFADGTKWSPSTLSTLFGALGSSAASSSDTLLVGGGSSDKLYALAGNDTLVGLAGTDFLFAGEGNDSLDGGADNDWLYGEGGNDTLDGGSGADTMLGGAGDDTYFVDNALDQVIEQASPDEPLSYDVIKTLVSYTAPLNVEALEAIGSDNINLTANDDGCDLSGNVGDNYLKGGDGLDFLYGDDGVDTLEGGAGNDYYYLTGDEDTVIEQVGGGLDQIWAFGNGIHMADNVERLYMKSGFAITAYGNDGKNTMVGNNRNNQLYGGGGNDYLSGLSGADALYGGLGDDSLVGGSGNDSYYFQRGDGADTVYDLDSTAGNSDALLFEGDIASSQLWLSRSANDLVVSVIGSSDKVTVQNWYLGQDFQIESIQAGGDGKRLSSDRVDALVNAMASFTPPAVGQTALPNDYQAALSGVLASSWT